MKKFLITIICLLGFMRLFALSYEDNEYQRKSRAYTQLSSNALDEGDYDASIEYSRLAEEYARLSAEFIQKMLARIEAEQIMNKARTRYEWAKTNKAQTRYPELFDEATEELKAGGVAFNNEDYDVATACAKKVLATLSGVEGDEGTLAGLPSTYKVRTWRGERDCLWTIAALDGIYGDGFMWKKLYEANKSKFPDPTNPDLVEPGMILVIQPLHGEERSGLYDHDKTYRKVK
ncbi:MAG: LysM peptidoglycan-binding domain-containing protein [Treponema sp.]